MLKTKLYDFHDIGQKLADLMKKTNYILSLLFLLPLSTFSQTRVDTVFTMSDGVQITATYIRPAGPPPQGGFPGLVLIHGFGGSKRDYANSAAPIYADSGYFSVAYTVRGQGRPDPATMSGGSFSWFTGPRELQDCQAIIEWLRARGDVNPDRVGIEGVSQGGLTAWGAAISNMNIRCAVPIMASPTYSQSFVKNGTVNYFFARALWTAKSLNLIELAPVLRDTLYNAIANGNYAQTTALIAAQDLDARVGNVTVPVFMQLAWQDDLFSGSEFFPVFHALRSPKKLMVWNGQHNLPGNDLAELRFRQTLRFYRRFLRDDLAETIMSPDSAVAVTDAATGTLHWFAERDSAKFHPANGQGYQLYFDAAGTMSTAPSGGTLAFPTFYLQGLSNEVLTFRSQPFLEDWQCTGASADLHTSASGTPYQMVVQLWEFNPGTQTRKPITRGAWESRTSKAGRYRFDLSPQLFTIRAGNQLEVRVKFGFPSLPANLPGDEFGQISFPPQANSFDTLWGGAAFPSSVTLYRAGRASAVETWIPPTPPAIATAVMRQGEELPELAGITPSQWGLYNVQGQRVGGSHATSHVSLSGFLPGPYFLRYRIGAEQRNVRVLILP